MPQFHFCFPQFSFMNNKCCYIWSILLRVVKIVLIESTWIVWTTYVAFYVCIAVCSMHWIYRIDFHLDIYLHKPDSMFYRFNGLEFICTIWIRCVCVCVYIRLHTWLRFVQMDANTNGNLLEMCHKYKTHKGTTKWHVILLMLLLPLPLLLLLLLNWIGPI